MGDVIASPLLRVVPAYEGADKEADLSDDEIEANFDVSETTQLHGKADDEDDFNTTVQLHGLRTPAPKISDSALSPVGVNTGTANKNISGIEGFNTSTQISEEVCTVL